MNDPYKVLGVERNADEAALRSAFRRLAKTHHPDLNPGDKNAEERFKEINTAYEVLSDPEKRARFDRGEIDGTGAERQPERPFYRDFGEQASQNRYRAAGTGGGFAMDDLEDLLRAFGSQGHASGFGEARRHAQRQGADIHYTITIDFLEAANGGKRRISLPDGQNLDLSIPEGIESGRILRLKGKGEAGQQGAAPGDALIEITVAPHAFFRREGSDIILKLPVTVQEAVLGAKIAVPTIKGQVNLSIAPNSSSGSRLRLKERGIKGGHQFVELEIVLPPEPEPELQAFLERWKPNRHFNPRDQMGAV